MIGRLLKDEGNQRGEVMLEASFILVSVILLLMALLSLSFLFYQEAMMTSVATEIASDVAKNYKFTEMEVGKSEIILEDTTSVKMFRMSFGQGGMEKAHKIRSEAYAEWRIRLATLGINSDEAEVDCEIISSGIGRAYVRVTVSQTSDFFLSEVLDFVGIAEKNTLFSSTAYAECSDLMAYTSMVNFTEYGSRKLNIFNGVGGLYDSVKKFANKLIK